MKREAEVSSRANKQKLYLGANACMGGVDGMHQSGKSLNLKNRQDRRQRPLKAQSHLKPVFNVPQRTLRKGFPRPLEIPARRNGAGRRSHRFSTRQLRWAVSYTHTWMRDRWKWECWNQIQKVLSSTHSLPTPQI